MREELTGKFVPVDPMDLSAVAAAPDAGKVRILATRQGTDGCLYFEPSGDFGDLRCAKEAAKQLVLKQEEPRTLWALVINDMGEPLYDTAEWVQ